VAGATNAAAAGEKEEGGEKEGAPNGLEKDAFRAADAAPPPDFCDEAASAAAASKPSHNFLLHCEEAMEKATAVEDSASFTGRAMRHSLLGASAG